MRVHTTWPGDANIPDERRRARAARTRFRQRVKYVGGALFGALTMATSCSQPVAKDDFRVYPYVQNPTPDSITIMWFSHSAQTGRLGYSSSVSTPIWVNSQPKRANALAYAQQALHACRQGTGCGAPYAHRARLRGLRPDSVYDYTVEQGSNRFHSQFRTAPAPETSAPTPRTRRPIRVILFADCETEPESSHERVTWSDPSGQATQRLYPIDQTRGFANNLIVIRSREPDLIAIAGDLVESGGEQQDWDEFWRHLTGANGRTSLAARVPILATPGNHEYYAGPALGRYTQPHSERAFARFATYFEPPEYPLGDSRRTPPDDADRYYRLDYGPLTLIALDVVNDSPHRSANDTNFFLRSDRDGGEEPGLRSGKAPDFGPGSPQYIWLQKQLRDAQRGGRFTVVFFHHSPYSVGPHGWPPGTGPSSDPQSGVPARRLTPLFLRYGVDLVATGHDEMWEHSQISGRERLPDGSERPHVVHFYDVGIGGDGLRGPQPGLVNPHQVFLAHRDAPEVWENGVLQAGGKHYGHLELNLIPEPDGRWRAVLEPVYILPKIDEHGQYHGFERRLYADEITLYTSLSR